MRAKIISAALFFCFSYTILLFTHAWTQIIFLCISGEFRCYQWYFLLLVCVDGLPLLYSMQSVVFYVYDIWSYCVYVLMRSSMDSTIMKGPALFCSVFSLACVNCVFSKLSDGYDRKVSQWKKKHQLKRDPFGLMWNLHFCMKPAIIVNSRSRFRGFVMTYPNAFTFSILRANPVWKINGWLDSRLF